MSLRNRLLVLVRDHGTIACHKQRM